MGRYQCTLRDEHRAGITALPKLVRIRICLLFAIRGVWRYTWLAEESLGTTTMDRQFITWLRRAGSVQCDPDQELTVGMD